MNLGGLLNVDRLEDILGSLLDRVERAEARADTLEAELRQRPTAEELSAWHENTEQHLEHALSRCAQLEGQVSQLQSELAVAADQGVELERCQQALARSVDIDTFQQWRAELLETLGDEISSLRSSKADRSAVQDVRETSQHLVEDLVAMQNLVSTKVDRAEVPLLNSASSRVQTMVEHHNAIADQVNELSAELQRVHEELQNKEDANVAAQRLQDVDELLRSKPDAEWVQRHVVARIEKVEQKVEDSIPLTKMRKQLSSHREYGDRMNRAEQALEAALQRCEELAGALEELGTEVESKADGELVRMHDQHLRTYMEDFDAIRERADQDHRVHRAYLEDVRQQVLGIRDQHAQLDKKVGVALKFIDWFAERKLAGAGAP